MHLDLLTGLSSEGEVSNVDYCRLLLYSLHFLQILPLKYFK